VAPDAGEVQGETEEVKEKSMRGLVEEVWLPQCLTIGVPYELFPQLNPRKIEPFKKAFKQRKEEEIATMNYNAWLNGLYVTHAVGACFSKNSKYPSQPIDITGKNQLTLKQKAELWALYENERYYQQHPEERPV
jgi:hypothetical protein